MKRQTFLALCALLLAEPSVAAEVEITFAPATFPSGGDVTQAIERLLRGAPGQLISESGRTALLSTSDAGYATLLANPALEIVKRLDAVPSTAFDGTREHAVWTVRIGAVNAANVAGDRNVEAKPTPQGVIVPELRGFENGRLLVIARDAGGNEIARQVVDDPRIVRYEGTDPATGRFIARRDFQRSGSAEVTVALPRDPRISTIDISNIAANGATALLGRAVIP